MTVERYTITDYLAAIRRRLKPMLLVLFGISGTATAFAILLPDTYVSSAEFRLDLEGPNVDLLEPVVLTNYADQYVRTLQQRVVQYDKLKAWLDESNIREEGETASDSELIAAMAGSIGISMVTAPVLDPRSGREVEIITGFRASSEGYDPVWAHYVADKVAAEFLAQDRAVRVERAGTTAAILEEQISAERQKIVELEAKIAEFKERNTELLPEMMALNMSLLERTERDMEFIQSEIRTLQQDRIFRQTQLEELRRKSGSAARLAELEEEYLRAVSIYGADHPDVIRISRQVAALTGTAAEGSGGGSELAQLEAELAAARERYSDEHPDIVSLRRRIATLRAQEQRGSIRTDIDGDSSYLQLRAQLNAIDTQLESQRARLEELRQKQADIEDRIARMPQVEREYSALNRDLQTAQLAFDDLRRRLTQAQQTESFESGERGARLELIRAPGIPAQPAGPPRGAIIILGVFLAVSMAAAAVLVAEALDQTVRGTRDVRVLMGMQPIAAIPIVQNSSYRAFRRRQLALNGAVTVAGAVALFGLLAFLI